MATTTASSDPDTGWWNDPAAIQAVRHYAHTAGLLYCLPPPPPPTSSSSRSANTAAVNIAVTLQPSKFPKELYELAWAIQPDINSLVDAVSRDLDFLKEALDRWS